MKKPLISITAISLLLIGIITSLSSFSSNLTDVTVSTATTGTTTTGPVNNGSVLSGVPCSYMNYVYSNDGNVLGIEFISGMGTVCVNGGSSCYTESAKTNITCIGTAKTFVPGSR